MRHLHLLHNALVAAGIPVRGLCRANNELTIEYLGPATDTQIEAAADIVAAWNGEAEDAAEDARLAALVELDALDRASIRGLREWALSRTGEKPAQLADIEARAEAERAKLSGGR